MPRLRLNTDTAAMINKGIGAIHLLMPAAVTHSDGTGASKVGLGSGGDWSDAPCSARKATSAART